MATSSEDNLLARLARNTSGASDNPWSFVAATPPADEMQARPAKHLEKDCDSPESRLNQLLNRVKSLTSQAAACDSSPATASSPLANSSPAPNVVPQLSSTIAALVRTDKKKVSDPSIPTPTPAIEALIASGQEFIPPEPASIVDAGLSEASVEELILKTLLARGDFKGRQIGEQIRLPFVLLEPLLRRMKYEQLLAYRDSAPMNDYVYQLTDMGRERARRFAESSTYCGSAPVTLADYAASVKAQSLESQHPTQDDLKAAFSDLLINPKMLMRLGPAINSGRGMFLYGYPGNGKTSIAERVTRAFGQYIWIPRCVGIEGAIIRIFDPMCHVEAPLEQSGGLLSNSKIDQRWLRIVRPTIIVGGELTMDNLEVSFNPVTGISEAPVQMKSNCGTLVIDDFGRQKMRTDELLNRWIVPLEKRVDYLNLSNGKKVQVPFDQLVIFSTNLQPKDLVDDAFLRRIPYKIEVQNPTEDEYRQLFRLMSPKLGFEYRQTAIDHLVENYYKKVNRPFRCCQPRDLLMQVKNLCLYLKRPLEMTPEYFDFAVENYFAVME